ncbi:MAG: hypothetical protein A2X78_02105 [Gammaproteobacteria bacterium GWE2_37_16]|nr:MAG: hypothetical protein A2X78_02105 [Gammaproteobacteria bacterium GWE2_37_16]
MLSSKIINALVVEDEEIAQTAAQHLLSELGCQVAIANTGYEALALLEHNHYDIIIMDLGIFDIDGLNITKKIRNMDGNIKNIPIIAVTMYKQSSLKKRAFDLGVNDFLVKPLTLSNCQSLLEKYVTPKF